MTGRRVQFSERERMLAEAQAAASALAHPDTSHSRRVQPLLLGLQAGRTQAQRRGQELPGAQQQVPEQQDQLPQQEGEGKEDVLWLAAQQQQRQQQREQKQPQAGEAGQGPSLAPYGSLDTPEVC